MKKVFIISLLLTTVFTYSPYASENDVIQILSEWFPDCPNDFYAKEYYSEDGSHCSLLITLTETDDYLINQEKIKEVATDIHSREWSNYDEILFVEYSIMDSFTYNRTFSFNVSEGSLVRPSNFIYRPWIIKSKDDMKENEVKLCWGVVDELFKYNEIWTDPTFEEKDFNDMEIQNWSDFALVKGTVHSDGRKYKYVMEFTFKNDGDSQFGTYDTKYIEINDIVMYGEYVDIETYSKDLFG